MAIRYCRVCGRDFFKEPLLQYEQMPKSAQLFPAAGAVAHETGISLTICQCSGCGLVQLDSKPVPYYKEVIRAAAVSAIIKNLKIRQFAEFVQKYSLRGKKVIEVGCGRGEFLSILQTLDIDAYGLEHSDSSVAQCLNDGLKVTQGYPDSETGTLPDGPFDGFLLLMFLEHMPDPNAALKAISDNLTEGAVGLVEVPNFDMMLRKELFSEFISDHLLYFSQETLQTALNLNGFEILEKSKIRDDYVISAEVKKRGKLDISGFSSHQAKVAAEINQYIDRFGVKSVAVWGAGHQALATLALTKIGSRIRYVIDSAPFKQGRFTPASHLPVVTPDTLDTDPVDAVIVMAASYSDEVAGILRRRFDPKINIAILRDFGLEIIN